MNSFKETGAVEKLFNSSLGHSTLEIHKIKPATVCITYLRTFELDLEKEKAHQMC
jgi:hypothetical protein